MTLRRALKRLRLNPGDIMVIRRGSDFNLLRRVMEIGMKSGLNFLVPIVEVEDRHDLETMPFEKLELIYLTAKKAHEDSLAK